MNLGEMIANTFAAVLLIRLFTIVFVLAGKPLFPRREARWLF